MKKIIYVFIYVYRYIKNGFKHPKSKFKSRVALIMSKDANGELKKYSVPITNEMELEIFKTIIGMYKLDQHVGETIDPIGIDESSIPDVLKIRLLNNKLQVMVEKENYEEAHLIKLKIKELENKAP